ncbi:MAG: TetR/AcrR family transcriptional regulator [Solibacillus sp.]
MEKVDRRIQRTKAKIKEVFIALLQEMPFEKVTVRMITERANINRGTFYLHYLDKFDLLEQLEQEILCTIEAVMKEMQFDERDTLQEVKDKRFPFMVRILEFFQEEQAFLNVVLSEHGDPIFNEKIRQVFVYNVENMLVGQLRAQQLNYPIELLVTYISYANLGILIHWLQQDEKQSAQELSIMLLDLMVKGPVEASGLARCFKEA